MHFKTFLIIALCVAYTIAQDSGEADADADTSVSDEVASSAEADNSAPDVEQLPDNSDADAGDGGDDDDNEISSSNAEADDAKPENEEQSDDDAANDETAENAESSENADQSADNDASESGEPEANESSENTEAASEEDAGSNASSEGTASAEASNQEAGSQQASEEAASQETSENSNETAENGSDDGSDGDSNDSDSDDSDSGSTEAPGFSCQSVGRFENPDSCEKYYFCWDTEHSYAIFSCPHHQAFDPVTKICGHDFSVCSSAPKCEMNKQIFPDPDDTSAYYECKLHSDGLLAHFELRKQECGKGREFDEEAGLCKKPEEDEEKGKPGKFQCNEVGVYIDIEDETKFYECLVKNVAKGEMKTVHRKCPKFHVFSLADRACVLLYP